MMTDHEHKWQIVLYGSMDEFVACCVCHEPATNDEIVRRLNEHAKLEAEKERYQQMFEYIASGNKGAQESAQAVLDEVAALKEGG